MHDPKRRARRRVRTTTEAPAVRSTAPTTGTSLALCREALGPAPSGPALVQRAALHARAAGIALPPASNQAVLRRGRGAVEERSLALADRSSGSALPAPVRARMEAAFGHDFGHVRVHTDGAAAQAADALRAHAFALGADLYFSAGEFAPGSPSGDRLLAHELTHVVQHDEGRLPRTGGVSSPTDPAEQEAYANEDRILSRLSAPAVSATDGGSAPAAHARSAEGPVLRDEDPTAPAGAEAKVEEAEEQEPTGLTPDDARALVDAATGGRVESDFPASEDGVVGDWTLTLRTGFGPPLDGLASLDVSDLGLAESALIEVFEAIDAAFPEDLRATLAEACRDLGDAAGAGFWRGVEADFTGEDLPGYPSSPDEEALWTARGEAAAEVADQVDIAAETLDRTFRAVAGAVLLQLPGDERPRWRAVADARKILCDQGIVASRQCALLGESVRIARAGLAGMARVDLEAPALAAAFARPFFDAVLIDGTGVLAVVEGMVGDAVVACEAIDLTDLGTIWQSTVRAVCETQRAAAAVALMEAEVQRFLGQHCADLGQAKTVAITTRNVLASIAAGLGGRVLTQAILYQRAATALTVSEGAVGWAAGTAMNAAKDVTLALLDESATGVGTDWATLIATNAAAGAVSAISGPLRTAAEKRLPAFLSQAVPRSPAEKAVLEELKTKGIDGLQGALDTWATDKAMVTWLDLTGQGLKADKLEAKMVENALLGAVGKLAGERMARAAE